MKQTVKPVRERFKRLICWFKGHKRGRTTHKDLSNNWRLCFRWTIKCKRCGYKTSYISPLSRLVGKEIELGFTGE